MIIINSCLAILKVTSSYSLRVGGDSSRRLNEWLFWIVDTLGNSLTSSCALPQNTGTPSNLTNFTPLDIYCPTFETWVEIIFNSEASVSHNFSFRRAWSRPDRCCDLDGYWLYTSPQRRNNGWWWLVNTHTSMLWWSMLHNWQGTSLFGAVCWLFADLFLNRFPSPRCSSESLGLQSSSFW